MRRTTLLTISALVLASPLSAQPAATDTQSVVTTNAQTGERITYVRTEVMTPMRDGVKLHAFVWRPANITEPLPILVQRYPYGFHDFEALLFDQSSNELAAQKYIFVLQDIRGRFRSEGVFKMLNASTKPGAIDESTDAYDSIDWLVKNLPTNNGKVGVYGLSYGGWLAAMATRNPHPALKAISAQAPAEDMWMGDDFHHNGALRLAYTWEYTAAMEGDGRTITPFDFKEGDTYSWFLRQTDLANLDNRHLAGPRYTWRNIVAHPNYDSFWKSKATSKIMSQKVVVPNLNVGGFWDQEDLYGPQIIYKNQERGDVHNRNFLVMGPWNHGTWEASAGRMLGPIDFGSDTGTAFRRDVQVKWFNHWLKGQGALDMPEAYIFQSGSNVWKSYKAWPPAENAKQSLYLGSNGTLSFNASDAHQAQDHRTYVSDPSAPVPYRVRPIAPLAENMKSWADWLVDDQRPFANRADVAVWQTPPLESDVTISGEVAAKLFASTTGSDSDWIVKLIDVYPEDDALGKMKGYQLMITSDVFRGRYRTSFTKPNAIKPNAVLEYNINLLSASHRFKRGHRIMVQIQSSWFPLIDRNPQKFVPNILNAQPNDFQKATQSIYFSSKYPSGISVALEND
jgi:uncharacterized protein